MKWEFTSWVPLVARMCPSDVYKVWKSGSNLRVDTTLLGFEHMTWQRGERSFIFKGQDNGALVLEVDHDRRVVYVESLALTLPASELLLQALRPTEEQLFNRLSSPIVTTHVNTKHIQFERSKSGIWGWRGDKCEVVNGYNTKVYSASSVELVTRTRTEHLSEQDKCKGKGKASPLQSFLGIAEQHIGFHNGAHITQTASATNPTAITAEEYFNPRFNLRNRDVGRPMNLTTKTQKFKAALWLCEAHPLSLSEQVIPIVDLMAISYSHFAKLRDFITLRLPPGFPIKIEIPLFHILNARITFGNLNGCEHPVSSVHSCVSSDSPSPCSDTSSWCSVTSSSSPALCEVESSVFEAPKGYTVAGCSKNEPLRDEDNDLLQFAIQQSLLDAGSESDQVTVWEALTNSKPGSHPLSQQGKCPDRPNSKPASSITSSAAHHSFPPISPRPGSSHGTPHRTSVSLGRARLKGGGSVQSSPAAKTRVGSPVQHRPTVVVGHGTTKANGGEEWTDTVRGSFAKQLRLAVHLSTSEHEERPRRQRRGGERGWNCPG
uniref:ankyrin repeat domain-containing protein 13B-like n=1 Tax=Myxine glutinosa TaxID=7769 RepID=UPI00358FBAB2